MIYKHYTVYNTINNQKQCVPLQLCNSQLQVLFLHGHTPDTQTHKTKEHGTRNVAGFVTINIGKNRQQHSDTIQISIMQWENCIMLHHFW